MLLFLISQLSLLDLRDCWSKQVHAWLTPFNKLWTSQGAGQVTGLMEETCEGVKTLERTLQVAWNMETLSELVAFCEGSPPLTCGFPWWVVSDFRCHGAHVWKQWLSLFYEILHGAFDILLNNIDIIWHTGHTTCGLFLCDCVMHSHWNWKLEYFIITK